MNNSTLLVDETAAFDEILRCVDAAQSSIMINMFIWRNDTIGNRLAHAVLQAADRGVDITISVDRVGMILECCEESEQSFFHKNPRVFEIAKIYLLRWCYPSNHSSKKTIHNNSAILEQLLTHPNVVIDRDRQKNDHSKYYIFDNRILIFGGINVEDKECGKDCAGRVYQDYMLKLDGEVYYFPGESEIKKKEMGTEISKPDTERAAIIRSSGTTKPLTRHLLRCMIVFFPS